MEYSLFGLLFTSLGGVDTGDGGRREDSKGMAGLWVMCSRLIGKISGRVLIQISLRRVEAKDSNFQGERVSRGEVMRA